MEMEQFASWYSAYNKCQMVYKFLSGIIDETGKRINEKTTILTNSRQKLEKELETKKLQLLDNQKTKDCFFFKISFKIFAISFLIVIFAE
jgi:hypothetical protein